MTSLGSGLASRGGTTVPAHADADSAEFWSRCADHELSVPRCDACGTTSWPPARFCPACHADGLGWQSVPGTGVVTSFVVVHRAFDAHFADLVPYAVVNVLLDGSSGVVVISNLVGVSLDALCVGLPVRVHFVEVGDATLPLFGPLSTDQPVESRRLGQRDSTVEGGRP